MSHDDTGDTGDTGVTGDTAAALCCPVAVSVNNSNPREA